MPFTRLCPPCSDVKIVECICGHSFRKRRSIATKESKRISVQKRIGTRRCSKCEESVKARHGALESESEALEPESEALLRKVHDRAKRVLEPESEALLRKEPDRASKAQKRPLAPISEA